MLKEEAQSCRVSDLFVHVVGANNVRSNFFIRPSIIFTIAVFPKSCADFLTGSVEFPNVLGVSQYLCAYKCVTGLLH